MEGVRLKYKGWIVAGFVVALAIFSFYHLSVAGSDYTVLTTSDSGYFYGIGRDINQQDGLIDEYSLSHAPQGKSVSKHDQFQPLMLVTMYRGLHSVNPGVSLMDVSKFFSPFLFSLALVGAFLAARELGGDIAGCASALFFATMTGSIYWTKIGAFDREISLIFFGTWIFYLLAKVFRAEGKEFLKYSVLAGLLYGMFVITWTGALSLAAVIGFAVALIILERAVSGLGITLTALPFLAVGYKLSQFNGDIAEVVGVLVLLLGLVRISRDWDSLKKIETRIISGIRANVRPIAGVLSLIGISTLVAMLLGGYSSNLWTSLFADRILGFLGISLGGGGGVSFPTIATEMQAAPTSVGGFLSSLSSSYLYNNEYLTGFTIGLVSLAILKAAWSSERRELLAFGWLMIVLPMPLSQARFFRLFWPLWPILAGFGLAVLFKGTKNAVLSRFFSTSTWVDKLRHPLVIALVGLILVVPFVHNATAYATPESPSPHGSTLPSVYNALMNSYGWFRENEATENSIVAVEWSHGHLLTGYANRPAVTDGAQTMRREGEWEEGSGIKPPDYIQGVRNNQGFIYGLDQDHPSRPYTIDGRRVDIESQFGTHSMYKTTEDNELKWLLETYRDNYGVKTDYIVFNEGPRRVNSSLFTYIRKIVWDRNDVPKSSMENQQGDNTVFVFDNEEIVLRASSTTTGTVSVDGITTKSGENLRGVIALRQSSDQGISYAGHKFFPNQKRENLLLVMYDQSGNVTDGFLFEFEGPPMLYRANQDYDMPDFLKKVYTTTEQGIHGNYTSRVDVFKVKHEDI